MSFNFKRLFGLAMVGMLVAFAPLLAGCGGAASTSGSGSSGGSSSGGTTGTVDVSGTVALLNEHLAQLGLTGVSLQSMDEKTKVMRVQSLKPFEEKLETTTVEFTDLSGTKFDDAKIVEKTVSGEKVLGYDDKISAKDSKGDTRGLVVTKAIFETATKGLSLPGYGFLEDNGTVTVSNGNSGAAVLSEILSSGDEALVNSLNELQKTKEGRAAAKAVFKAAESAIKETLGDNAQIATTLAYNKSEKSNVDAVTGLPKAAVADFSDSVESDEVDAAVTGAQNAGGAALVASGKGSDNELFHLAKSFLGFVSIKVGDKQVPLPMVLSESGMVPYAKKLVELTKAGTKLTLKEMIAKAVPVSGQTISVTAAQVISGIKVHLAEMDARITEIQSGKKKFEDSFSASSGTKPQEGGQGQGPDFATMMSIQAYMKNIVLAEDTKMDALVMPAVFSLVNEISQGAVDVIASMKNAGVEPPAGADFAKGFVDVSSHPEVVSTGTGIDSLAQKEYFYIHISLVGDGYKDINGAKVKFTSSGAKKSGESFILKDVQFTGITENKPDKMFVMSPSGQLDNGFRQRFGLKSPSVQAILVEYNDICDSNGNITWEYTLTKDGTDQGAAVSQSQTFHPPFTDAPGKGGGFGGGAAIATMITPTPPSGQLPDNIAKGLPLVVSADVKLDETKIANLKNKFGKAATTNDVRYRFNIVAPPAFQSGGEQQGGQQGTPPQGGQQGTPPQGGQQGTPPQGGQQGTPPQGGQQGTPPQGSQQGTPPQDSQPKPSSLVSLHEETSKPASTFKILYKGDLLKNPKDSIDLSKVAGLTEGEFYVAEIEVVIEQANGADPQSIGGAGAPFTYGDLTTALKNPNSGVAMMLGSKGVETAQKNTDNFSGPKEVKIPVVVSNKSTSINGTLYAALITHNNSAGKFEKKAVAIAKVGDDGKATLTIPAESASAVLSAMRSEVGVFYDVVKNDSWDNPEKDGPIGFGGIDPNKVEWHWSLVGDHFNLRGGGTVWLDGPSANNKAGGVEITSAAPYAIDISKIPNAPSASSTVKTSSR